MSINFEDLFSSSLTDQPAIPTQSNQVDWDGYFGTEFKQQKQADVGLAYGELSKQLGDGTYKKSLVDLEKDKEYQQIAGDFLRDIGESGDDIFEYMRDEDFNLVDGFQRWADATNLSEINKQRYAYLRTAFDNASLGSFGQGMELVKDATIDIVTDPTNILGIVAGLFTGGTATAASFAARKSAAEGFKATMKNFAKSTVVPTPTNLRNTGTTFAKLLNLDNDAARILGNASMISAYEGLAHIGLGDVARQGTQIATNIKEAYNPLQTAAMLPLGTSIGTLAPGAFTTAGIAAGKIVGPMAEAGSKAIGLDRYQQKLLSDYKAKIDNYENEDFVRKDVSEANFNFFRKLNRLTGDTLGFLTFARQTAPLRGLADQSPSAKLLLQTLKRDEAQKYTDLPELVKGLDFSTEIEAYRGTVRQKFMEILQPIFEVDESIFSREFRLSPDINEQLTAVLQGKKVYGKDSTPISKVVLDAGQKLRNLDTDIYRDAMDAGLNVRFIKNHVPRYYLREGLIENKDIFIKELIDKGEVTPIAQDFVDEIARRPELQRTVTITMPEADGTGSRQVPFHKVYSSFPEEMQEIRIVEIQRNYPQLAKDIQDRKALEIYESMIDQANVDMTYDVKSGGGRGNFNSRAFDKISDEFLIDNGIIEGDMMRAFQGYFNRSLPIITRTKRLGYNLDDFRARYSDKIKDELEYKLDSKGNLLKDDKGLNIKRDTPLKLSQQDRKYLDDLYMYTTGKGLNGSGIIAEQVVPHMQLINATAYLPLATVSSLTELALPLARANVKQYASEVGKPARELTDAMVNKTKLMFNQQVDELRGLGLTGDEIDREFRLFGFAVEQSGRERVLSLSGESISDAKFFGVGPKITTLQDGFYKFNMLRDWTASVERTSFVIGKRIIADAAEELSKGGLKASKELRLREQLVELGINPEDAIKWYRNGSKKYGKANKRTRTYERMSDGRVYDPFYYQLLEGATSFTNEVILNPSAASALKPKMYTHPQAKLLFQFLSYPSAFSNTVLKKGIQRSTRSMARGDLTNPAKLLSTFAIMATAAMYLNNLRSSGKEFEKSTDEIFLNAWSRTGVTGVFDTVNRVAKNIQYGGRGVPTVLAKAIGGPTVSDVIEMFQFNRGLTETFSRKIPVINQILRTGIIPEGEDVPKILQQAAREFDKDTYQVLEDAFVAIGLVPEKVTTEPTTARPDIVEPERIKRDRGGRVYANIPGVKPEPEDTKVRGMPYTFKELAGFIVEDDEDRLGFAVGGVVGSVASKGFSKFMQKFFRSNLKGSKHTELHSIFDEQTKNLDKIFSIRTDESKVKLNNVDEVAKNIKGSKVQKDVYLNYTGDDVKDIMTYQYFDMNTAGVPVSTKPVAKGYKAKVAIKNPLEITGSNKAINVNTLANDKALKMLFLDKVKSRSHEYGKFDSDLEGLFKDFDRVKQKFADEEVVDMTDRKIATSFFNTQLFNILEKAGFDSIKQGDTYLIPNIKKLFMTERVSKEGDLEKVMFDLDKKNEEINERINKLVSVWWSKQDEATQEAYNELVEKSVRNKDVSIEEYSKITEQLQNDPVMKKFYNDVPEAARLRDQLETVTDNELNLMMEDIKPYEAQATKVTDIGMKTKSIDEQEYDKVTEAVLQVEAEAERLIDIMGGPKTGKELEDSINRASTNITKKLKQTGMPELEIARLIRNAIKENPDNEMFWAADDKLYKAMADTVSDKELMTPAEQANWNFDEFGNRTTKKEPTLEAVLNREESTKDSELGELITEFDRLTQIRETMVANRLAKLSDQDKIKRQELLDEFFGTEAKQGEDGLWAIENNLGRKILTKLENQGIEVQINSAKNRIIPEEAKTPEYKKVEKRIKEINKILEEDFGEYIETYGEGILGQPTGVTKTEYDLIT